MYPSAVVAAIRTARGHETDASNTRYANGSTRAATTMPSAGTASPGVIPSGDRFRAASNAFSIWGSSRCHTDAGVIAASIVRSRSSASRRRAMPLARYPPRYVTVERTRNNVPSTTMARVIVSPAELSIPARATPSMLPTTWLPASNTAAGNAPSVNAVASIVMVRARFSRHRTPTTAVAPVTTLRISPRPTSLRDIGRDYGEGPTPALGVSRSDARDERSPAASGRRPMHPHPHELAPTPASAARLVARWEGPGRRRTEVP